MATGSVPGGDLCGVVAYPRPVPGMVLLDAAGKDGPAALRRLTWRQIVASDNGSYYLAAGLTARWINERAIL